jgi:predicted RecA/RadA family phage recombinase
MLLTPDLVPVVVASGASARVEVDAAARFQAGDQVLIRNMHPLTHTRLPAYVRGKRATIERDYGVFAFPDTHAHGQGDKPQHCYSVRIAARELWGPDASPNDALLIDLFDDYLDRA